jgi:hypothetical protein
MTSKYHFEAMKKLLPLLFASVGVLAALPAKADLPMKISQAEELYMLTVPDTDTTKSAFGGKLSRYDIHIAKIHEVTDHLCQKYQMSPEAAMTWDYSAGNGSINMGRFRISCEDAFGAFQSLGLGKAGKPEKTVIHRSDEAGKDQIVLTVPVLPLDKNTINRWQTMVQRFKPIQ